MKIWSNFNHSKVPNYGMAKVFKEKIPHRSLPSHNTSYIESQYKIWKVNQHKNFHFVMF
jgi:hypothetical protein